jgi:crossover junction endodeoxyribonuclease RusA
MIRLPYPPSTNRYWRSFRGRMVRSKVAVDYKQDVQTIAIEAGVALHHGCVEVVMILCPALPKDWQKRCKKDPLWALGVRRIDLDNAQKVALDALQGIAYDNDRQITKLSISLGEPVEAGALKVGIKEDCNWRNGNGI